MSQLFSNYAGVFKLYCNTKTKQNEKNKQQEQQTLSLPIAYPLHRYVCVIHA